MSVIRLSSGRGFEHFNAVRVLRGVLLRELADAVLDTPDHVVHVWVSTFSRSPRYHMELAEQLDWLFSSGGRPWTLRYCSLETQHGYVMGEEGGSVNLGLRANRSG